MNKINFKKLGKSILIVLLYLVIIPFLVSLPIAIFLKDIDNDIYITIANLAIYVINLIIVLIIYRKSLKKDWQNFWSNKKVCFKKAFKNWILGFLAMVVINLLIISLVGDIAVNESQNREILTKLPVFSIITMVFLGPVLEELVFRKNFREAFNSDKLFMICTALIFGSMHLLASLEIINWTDIKSVMQLLYIFSYSALGYFFAKAYVETDSIFTSMICHIVHNGLSVLVILLGSSLL